MKAKPSEQRSGDEHHETRGCRILHVPVPEDVFNHAKAQAALSGMSFRRYVERFLQEAQPYRAGEAVCPPGSGPGVGSGEQSRGKSSDQSPAKPTGRVL